MLEAKHKKGGVFKYPKFFQYENEPDFKSDVEKWIEKHNIDVRKSTRKYWHTHTAFVELFNKELAKQLFKPMDAQKLQDPKKISTKIRTAS